MDDTRKYQGKEIEALLAAAARMQQREEDHAGSHDTGLTLSEIEEIARESGIDPQFVRMAAYSRADDREAAIRSFFGLVVADWQIRKLLGEATRPSATGVRQTAERAVEEFLLLYGAGELETDKHG